MRFSLRILLAAIVVLGALFEIWVVFPPVSWVPFNPCCGRPAESYPIFHLSFWIPVDGLVFITALVLVWALLRFHPLAAALLFRIGLYLMLIAFLATRINSGVGSEVPERAADRGRFAAMVQLGDDLALTVSIAGIACAATALTGPRKTARSPAKPDLQP